MNINASLKNYPRFENVIATEPNIGKLNNRTRFTLDIKISTQMVIEQVEMSEEAYQKWLKAKRAGEEEKELPIIHNMGRIIIPNIQTNQ